MDLDALVAAVGQGDKAAFNTLYRVQYRPLLALATGLLAGDRAAAEDVVDTAFIAIWQGASSLTEQGGARGWMRRILRNKAVDWLRINARYDLGLEASDLTELRDPASDPECLAIGTDAARRLVAALSQLSLDQREAVMLCYFEDLPLAQIAAIAGCPEGTVKTRLFHARKALRARLPGSLEILAAVG